MMLLSHLDSHHFFSTITMYNNVVFFNALGEKMKKEVDGQNGIHKFQVSGQLTHNISLVLRGDWVKLAYSEIFILGDGGNEEVKMRAGYFEKKKLRDPVLIFLQKKKKRNSSTIHMLRCLRTQLEF